MENILYKEFDLESLEEYGNIPFFYRTNKKYELNKVNNGLGGITLDVVEVEEYYKDFGTRVSSWGEMFDLSNWKFFAAYNENNKMVGGCVVATKTSNCNMLEKRDDLALIWELKVDDNYKHCGIGHNLFNMAKEYAKQAGFKQLKVECQNTNYAAVNFYHKQGMVLGVINEYAYKDYPNEVQLLWYLDL